MSTGNWCTDKYLLDLPGNEIFIAAIENVYALYANLFGERTMSGVECYVDNVYVPRDESGKTLNPSTASDAPITIPVFKKILVVKLGVRDLFNYKEIVFQFSHELCHCLFYSLMGLSKDIAGMEEESICTAMSLYAISRLCPDQLTIYEKCIVEHEREAYRSGYALVKSVSYNEHGLKKRVEEYVDRFK